MLSPNALADAIRRIGPAWIFIGDPLVADSMDVLGETEGDITVDLPFKFNDYVLTERTGDAPLETSINAGALELTLPVIDGDPLLLARITPHGGTGIGWDGDITPTPTSLLVIPKREVGGGLSWVATQWVRTAGNDIDAASGVAAAPVHALWIWKAVLRPGTKTYGYANGLKSMQPVIVKALVDPAKPQGHKVATFGDPRAASVSPIIPVLV